MTTVLTADDATSAPPPGDTGLDVVTGAFSYSGASIARALQDSGRDVRTITAHPGNAPSGSPIEARPLDFDDPIGLTRSLEGATTLFNTYWVRFAHGQVDHTLAVANSRALFQAAKRAGVQRIVHVSITHPSSQSPWPYFAGKALVERALAETELSYAVLRPAILFGGDGVLINNIAWLLRHLPVFAVGGRGDYRVRGIHVDDLARLCVAKGLERHDSVTDAVGPERPTFLELVRSIRQAVGSHSLIVRVPGTALTVCSRALGLLLHDVLLTKEEYRTMAQGLADTEGPATGETVFSVWLAEHADELGHHYVNEIDRHFLPSGRWDSR
ncbi:MAG TPA: NAD(P)H-binding protein [Acidimicrobiales bacterium]|jgi:NADH dehydrogenase|nr:NAD(P)H-binding protein [Acidimicrobiales bacterium]